MPYLVNHAGETINRYHIHASDITAYRSLRGRDFTKTVMEFGEQVMVLSEEVNFGESGRRSMAERC